MFYTIFFKSIKISSNFEENFENLIPRKTYMSRSNIASCTDLYFCPHEIELWHLFKPLIKYCYQMWNDFYIFFHAELHSFKLNLFETWVCFSRSYLRQAWYIYDVLIYIDHSCHKFTRYVIWINKVALWHENF